MRGKSEVIVRIKSERVFDNESGRVRECESECSLTHTLTPSLSLHSLSLSHSHSLFPHSLSHVLTLLHSQRVEFESGSVRE